ncbi:MAG: tetratricopeptide repeat protein [Terriglobia bacterium]
MAVPANQAQARNIAHQGMNTLMNGDVNAAIAAFQQVKVEDSASPLGYVLEADAIWWKIYYSTANLVDPDVFDVVTSYHTPDDARFESAVATAIQKAKANIQSRRNVAQNNLYEGMAYALEARLAGLRARDLPAARAGKKMHVLLLTALQLDPSLTDAYAGIGLYNYFVDTLPTVVKMLRFLIGLPGGNRALGLEQMAKAAESGEFTRAEAQFYLAKDYTRRNEMQFAKALDLFQQLATRFPENPFWKMMVASCHMRLGQDQQGDAAYRRVLAESAQEKTIAAVAVHSQVKQALERLHPGKKIE